MLGGWRLCFVFLAVPLCAQAQKQSPKQVSAHDASNRVTIPPAAGEALDPTAAAARNELLSAFLAEKKQGSYIFYTQAYTSSHRHRVKLHGSIFRVIQNAQASGCRLRINSAIIDQYSGSIGSKLVGQTQSKYLSTAVFRITPKMANDLKIVDARPMRQLARGTHAVCSGNRKCTLTWLEVEADAPVIRATDTTSDVADYDGEVEDFDGAVDHVYLPVSSAEAGDELIARMRAFAKSCASRTTSGNER